MTIPKPIGAYDSLSGLSGLAALQQSQTKTTDSKDAAQTKGVKSSKEIESAKRADAAEQFESMLIQQMLKSMWSTVPSEGLLTGSDAEQMYRDMLNQGVADTISKGQGIGIKDVVVKDMEKFDHSAGGGQKEEIVQKPLEAFNRLNNGKRYPTS